MPEKHFQWDRFDFRVLGIYLVYFNSQKTKYTHIQKDVQSQWRSYQFLVDHVGYKLCPHACARN